MLLPFSTNVTRFVKIHQQFHTAQLTKVLTIRQGQKRLHCSTNNEIKLIILYHYSMDRWQTPSDWCRYWRHW